MTSSGHETKRINAGKEANMELFHIIIGVAWFGYGAFLGSKDRITDMLICFAISSIWLATV